MKYLIEIEDQFEIDADSEEQAIDKFWDEEVNAPQMNAETLIGEMIIGVTLQKSDIDKGISGREKYIIKETASGCLIDNIFIDSNKEYEYEIRNREDLITMLQEWACESDGEDKYLMTEDIKYLSKLDDEFILSSTSTNEYLIFSENEKEFNEECKALIKLNIGDST